jgi:RNA polymerase sigma factor (sigma-70 family)
MVTASSKRLIAHPSRDRREHLVESSSDEVLLAMFIEGAADRSQEGFRTLVARHGPMVMSVCCHVLQNAEDAEDAFQATFLALARKADTVRDRRLVAGWLYEVAYRVAIRARATSVRRRDQERLGAAMTATTTDSRHESDVAWAELRPVLHDEVNRLPDKYRLPIVLSYLEGKTNEEVAGLLDWPVGTVKGRLSRARDLLRSRLVRRGLALSAAFLCSSLSQGVVFGEVVPESLIDQTLNKVLRAQRVAAATGGGAAAAKSNPVESAAPSRVEELAEFAFRQRSSWPAFGRFLVLAIAMAAAAYAVFWFGRINFSFPSKWGEFLSALWHGSSSGGCH